MMGVTGKGRAVGYQTQYVGGKMPKASGSNVGVNFREIKSVLDGNKFATIVDTRLGSNEQTVFYDMTNTDIDDATMNVLDEINSIGKIVSIESKREDRCVIVFRDGRKFALMSHNNRFLAWAYKKIHNVSENNGIGLTKIIE